MLRLGNVAAPLDAGEKEIAELVLHRLRIRRDELLSVKVKKKSVDARDKGDVHFVLTLDVCLKDENAVLRHLKPGIAARVQPPAPMVLPKAAFEKPPVVVGAGPAGLFAALTLARAGAQPILIERGKPVEARAQDVARMADDRFFSIHPRRGTNSILDRKAGAFMHSIASVKGSDMVSKTHSKGGGILHTVHDNLLIGPDAVETYEKENTATYPESIAHVFSKQKITMPALTERDIITYFTGVRAPTFEEDFIIERGRRTHNLIHVAGIQSPGLTTAPAVAVDVADMAVRILARERPVAINPDFDPHRPGIPVLREMDDATRAAYIAKNPDYGVIVCRCEEISRGEILDALRSNVCVPTVDGVKKRVRPGMGRCQGGFCSPQVVRIIAEYLGVPLSAVRKSSADAPITFGPTKSGEVQA